MDGIVRKHPEIDLSAVRSRLEVFQSYGDNVGDSTCLAHLLPNQPRVQRNHRAGRIHRRPRQSKMSGGASVFSGRYSLWSLRVSLLGGLVDVSTPEIDRLIEWGQKIMEKEGVLRERQTERKGCGRHSPLGLHAWKNSSPRKHSPVPLAALRMRQQAGGVCFD